VESNAADDELDIESRKFETRTAVSDIKLLIFAIRTAARFTAFATFGITNVEWDVRLAEVNAGPLHSLAIQQQPGSQGPGCFV
jgi:hypothetical protein